MRSKATILNKPVKQNIIKHRKDFELAQSE